MHWAAGRWCAFFQEKELPAVAALKAAADKFGNEE